MFNLCQNLCRNLYKHIYACYCTQWIHIILNNTFKYECQLWSYNSFTRYIRCTNPMYLRYVMFVWDLNSHLVEILLNWNFKSTSIPSHCVLFYVHHFVVLSYWLIFLMLRHKLLNKNLKRENRSIPRYNLASINQLPVDMLMFMVSDKRYYDSKICPLIISH